MGLIFKSFILCLLLHIFILLQNESVFGQYSIQITSNQLSPVRAYSPFTLATTNLFATIVTTSATSVTLKSMTFNIVNLVGARFVLINKATNTTTDVSSFSLSNIDSGIVQFIPDGSLLYPSYSVWADATFTTSSNTVMQMNSTTSAAQISYTKWTEGIGGTPKPIIVDLSNSTTVVFEVTMFKRNLDSPPASFMLGLSAPTTACQTSSNSVLNFLSDGFVLKSETQFSQTFVYSASLTAHLANSKISKVNRGVYIDATATIYSSYMVADASGKCVQTTYSDNIITQSYLGVNTQAVVTDMTLTPNKLSISDSNYLDIGFLLKITGLNNANLFNWQMTGPKSFSINYPILADVKTDYKVWHLSFTTAGKVSDGEDFSGTYYITFEAQVSGNSYSTSYSVSFTMQYYVPDQSTSGGGLNFDTQIDTYKSNDFSTAQPQTQFYRGQQLFAKVSTTIIQTSAGGLSPIPSSKQVAPYNIFICCTKNLQAIPSNQCRQYDSTIMSYQKQLMVNGTINSTDTDVVNKFKIKSPETIIGITDWGTLRHMYVVSMYLDALIVNQTSTKRCFFSIDTYLVAANLLVSRSTNGVAASSSMSTASRAFDFSESVQPVGSPSAKTSTKPISSVATDASKKNGQVSVEYICDSRANINQLGLGLALLVCSLLLNLL